MLIPLESEGFLSECLLCAVFAQTCNLLCIMYVMYKRDMHLFLAGIGFTHLISFLNYVISTVFPIANNLR